MKQFEHEVLFFENSKKSHREKMRDELKQWGLSGFEVVGVSETAPNLQGGVTVFLKRELVPAAEANGDAA